jgi:phenylacetate-coenzyme A ligase PaaK-like adenylate-forming protein
MCSATPSESAHISSVQCDLVSCQRHVSFTAFHCHLETHMVTCTVQEQSLEVRHGIPAALPTATEMLDRLHNSEGCNKMSIYFVVDCSRKILGTACKL